jgi:hypothetical protein
MYLPFSDVIDFNLPSLPHVECANKMHAVADAFAVHPGYQDPLPTTIPTADEAKEVATQYGILANDRNRTAERDLYRPKAIMTFAIIVNWAVMRYHRENNPSLIANLGFDQKKKVAPKSRKHLVPGAPTKVSVVHALLSGSVMMNIAKVLGCLIYEIQFGQGDPTMEESWTGMIESALCRSVEIKGLEPGKVYHFRVRCVGAGGRGPWSSVISLMVI